MNLETIIDGRRDESRRLMKVNGSIEGLKKSTLVAIEGIYDIAVPQDMLWTAELIDTLAFLSGSIRREIAVYIDRKGRVTDVTVGDFKTVDLEDVEGKRSDSRLSGIRCIHTHPENTGELSAADISSMKLMKLDMIAAVGLAGKQPAGIFAATPSFDIEEGYEVFGPLDREQADFKELMVRILDADSKLRAQEGRTGRAAEKAILIGIRAADARKIHGTSEADISMAELIDLADTAGASVVAHMIQNRESRDAAYLVGKGKIEELRLMVQAQGADLVIFDEELSPSQQRNIEEALGVKVIDRTGLILDIFAQRARSREGKIQVELAQLEYILPRLAGKGVWLSRLGGGIGTRGPGETKLETDRRHIRRKIDYLKEQLKIIKKQRGLLRMERIRNRVPAVSLVGYTNAGKSSLLNALCGSDVYAEDKLFATLDTTTRKLYLDENSHVLLTDTVGFIRNLPHFLLDAFKSTLEETVFSNAVVIVADATDPNVADHVRIVDEILGELGAADKPSIIALNKIDKPGKKFMPLPDGRKMVEVSTLTHEGLDELKDCLRAMLMDTKVRCRLRIPFSEGSVLSWLYENGSVISTGYDESATLVEVELDREASGRVAAYRTDA
jgi:GTP-binding protein HflX